VDTDLAYKFLIFLRNSSESILQQKYVNPSDVVNLKRELDNFKVKLSNENAVDDILHTEISRLDLDIDAKKLEKGESSAIRFIIKTLYVWPLLLLFREGSKSQKLKFKVEDFRNQIDHVLFLRSI